MTQVRSDIGKWIVAALCTIGGALGWYLSKQRLKVKARRFEDRKRLSLAEIHRLYYEHIRLDEFSDIWIEIAKGVEVSPEKMRPTDRFDGELGSVKGFPMADEFHELQTAFEARCRARNINPEEVTAKINNVDDYIRVLCR